MAKRGFTQEEKEFIAENRLKMTISEMAKVVETGTSKVQIYLRENGLSLTEDEKNARGYRSTAKRSEWVLEPWNKGLNLITMHNP